jgi:CheY-like chemotaxis protein
MVCPRCRAEVVARPDAAGVIVCPACKAQLKVKNPGSMPPTPAGNVTLPAGVRPPVAPPGKPAPAVTAKMKVPTKSAGDATMPVGAPAVASAPAAPAPVPVPQSAPASLDDVMGELKALRGLQVEILSMLKAMASVTSSAVPPLPASEESVAPPPPPVRSRRRKTVLVIDDDDETRKEAVAALEQAEVPVRGAADGNSGLEAMANERPDVVVLELGMGGRMAGKDVVNMVKATMEWVDIPIVLYTRVHVENQKEARITHGADELVPKGPGAAEALVARVIALFRRG